jgi:hypothetical protein
VHLINQGDPCSPVFCILRLWRAEPNVVCPPCTIVTGRRPPGAFRWYWNAAGLRKEQVVGRARRAWLPPSATWLFRPRNATHTTGPPQPCVLPLASAHSMRKRQANDKVNHVTAAAHLPSVSVQQCSGAAAPAPSGAGTLSSPPPARSIPRGYLQQPWCYEQPSRLLR